MAEPVSTALALYSLYQVGQNEFNRQKNIAGMEQELANRGIDIPWQQKWLPKMFGIFGASAQEHIYGSKLERTQPSGIKGVDSADLTAAALKEMEAARNIMSRQAQSDIARMRPAYAGVYQSGARQRAEMNIREQYAGRLADALAGISIESQRAAAALQQGDMMTAMQQAELSWRKQAAESQMYGDILAAVLPYLMKSQASPAAPEINPAMELYDMGFDVNELYGWKRRNATLQDYLNFELAENPIRFGGSTDRNSAAYGAFRELDEELEQILGR